jgi:acyl-CoA synthetase (NDP forming)
MAFLRDFTLTRQKTRTRPERYPVAPDAVRGILDRASAEQRRELFCHEAIEVLEHYGICAIETEFAADVGQARVAAERLGYPLAMKIVSPQISHKSDLGGVVLDLGDEAELVDAFERVQRSVREAMPEAELRGMVLQKMAGAGQEMILGAESHPSTGHALMLGMGGTLVEILDDVSFRIPPLSREEAAEMIEELRGHRVLSGFRGGASADLRALSDAVLRLAQLVEDFPEIEQIDVNPLVVYGKGRGLRALDSRIVF